MAQADTGLGWSAKEEWLRYSNLYELGILTSVNLTGEAVYSGNIRIAGSTDVMSDSIIYGGYNLLTLNGDPLYIALAPAMPLKNPYAFLYTDNWGNYVICFVSDVDLSPAAYNADVRGYWAFGSETEVRKWALWRWPASSTYDDATGLYYVTWATNQAWTGAVEGDAYMAASLRDGLDHYGGVRTTFTKDGNGYAVACMAKWKTANGTVLASPVLISNDTDYVDALSDGGQTQNKLNILYNGVKFYMSFFQDFVNGNIYQANCPTFDLSGSSDPALTLEQLFRLIASQDYANIRVTVSPDPYQEEGEESSEEGGDGTDLEDDPVEEETLPVPSVAGHGFCTIYVPSAQELGQMASYLWSGAFDVSQVIKLFSNPMDSILGLSAVPVDLVGTPEQIYLGGVALSNITMPKYTGRTSVKVDFGTVTVEKRWGSYLDYSPYTDFSIYLPFIGIKSIKADDIMGKTVSLMYAIDILSGGCVAYLRPAGGSVLYEWSGQCALQIPVTGRSYDNVFQSAMSVATAAFAAVTAPASAPVLSGAVASAAVQAAATKPHIERSGTVNGITGFLGQLRPYLIRTIPEAYIPADQNKFIGYPAYINVDLATVEGYNEVDSIHLENVTATGAELDEIESILKGGVIF